MYTRTHVVDLVPRAAPEQLSAYLASLPSGLESYPECQIKGAFSRALLAALPAAPRGLPGPLAELVDAPPLVNSWIHEVHHQALIAGIIDRLYPARVDAFMALMFSVQRDVLGGRIYAPLMQLISPARLLAHAARRWSNFHRGSRLIVERRSPTAARVTVEHPPRLYTEVGRLGLAQGFCAAIEASRGRDGAVELERADERRTIYRATWS